jgi:1-acyl-sn-glycerol-3-phosphate acyltransferase
MGLDFRTRNRSSLVCFCGVMAAAEAVIPVTPAAITCEWPGGDAGKEAAYWGDRTLLPQLWNLLCYREVRMTVWFGDPVPTAASRKDLAARLHGAGWG